MFIWTSMLLTDDEYATLARSARAILGKGGGALQDVLESAPRPTTYVVRPPRGLSKVAEPHLLKNLRRWRQPVPSAAEAKS